MHPHALALLTAAVFLLGCADDAPPAADPDPAAAAPAHDYPSEGPHGGTLIELGSSDYPAELVHDEAAQSVTVYLLDASAAQAVAIDAQELLVNVTHDGQPEQFKLAASPAEGDPEGKASRFVSEDQELIGHLHEHGAGARLVVKIEGRSYSGEIAHSHSHEQKGHEHDGHEHGDHEHGDHDH